MPTSQVIKNTSKKFTSLLQGVKKHLFSKYVKSFIKYVSFIILGLIILACSYFRVFDLYELQTFDLRFKNRPTQEVADEIVIIEIANDSLEALGVWPIDRQYYALLIDILSSVDVHSIIFDINLAENSEDISRGGTSGLSSDNLLASAIEDSGRVIMPVAYHFEFQTNMYRVENEMIGLLPKFRRGAARIGHVNVIPGIDGTVRKIIPVADYQGQRSYYLGFLAALNYLQIKSNDVVFKPGKFIDLGTHGHIPLLETSEMIINFPGRWTDTYKHYSFIDIIRSYIAREEGGEPIVDLEELKGKVCFVGLTATGTYDQFSTPIDNRYPGVGVHANIFNSIVKKSFISRGSRYLNVLTLLTLSLLVFFIVRKVKPVIGFLSFFLIGIGFTVINFGIFIFFQIWINLIYPLIIISLIYLVMTFLFFIREKTKREIIEKELDIARKIQESFVPNSSPEGKGLDISFRMMTARHVGGDLYDFVDLGEKVGILLGDVSGKGVPAALYMAKAVSEFKLYSKDNPSPADVVTKLNNQLAEEEAGSLFVTAMYLVYDPPSKQMCITSAGHGPVLIAQEKENLVKWHDVNEGMPVGVLESEFEEKTISVRAGDIIVLYTDGVTEARNKKGEEYGEDRLAQFLKKIRNKSSAEILNSLYDEVLRFANVDKQHDDITAIVIKIK